MRLFRPAASHIIYCWSRVIYSLDDVPWIYVSATDFNLLYTKLQNQLNTSIVYLIYYIQRRISTFVEFCYNCFIK